MNHYILPEVVLEMYPENTIYEYIDSFSDKSEELKRLNKIIEDLRNKAPYINWTTRWNDHENILGEPKVYVTLVVPVEQSEEAAFIYEMYSSGENISNYIPESKYPGIFIYQENKWVIEDKIDDFINFFNGLDYSFSFHEQWSVEELLSFISKTFQEIYEKALDLPAGETYPNIKCNYRNRQDDYIIFTEDQIIKYYIEYHVDLLLISDKVNQILNDVLNYSYLYQYQFDKSINQAEFAEIVFAWKRTFFIVGGWGEIILETLLLIHQSISKINNFNQDSSYEIEE